MAYSFNLIHNLTTYPIQEPVGFTDLELILRKDSNYEGIFFERGGQLGFDGDARNIILQALENGHFENEIILEVIDDCDSSFLYRGRLNLTSYTDEDGVFTCNIESIDKLVVFANNVERKESVVNAPNVQVDMHGVIFQLFVALSWLNSEPTQSTSPDPYTPTPIQRKAVFSVRTQEPDFENYFIWEQDGTDTWLRCIKPVSINFTIPVVQLGTGFDNCIRGGQDNFSPAHSASFTVFGQTVTLRPYDLDPQGQELYTPLGGYDYEAIFEGGTYTRVCNVGDILNIRYTFYRNPNPTGCDTLIPYSGGAKFRWGEAFINSPPYDAVDNTVKIFFNSDPFPTSRVKSYLVHELLDDLIKKASNNQLQLYSKYYGRAGQRDYGANGCGAWRVLTTGFHIRDKNIAVASFKEIFDGLRAIDNLALAYEVINNVEYIRIEPKDTFFDNTSSFFNAEGVDIKTSLATNKIFKLIDIGYQKWETEYTEGLLEFNSTRQYEATNITQFKQTKNAISTLIAGSYLIEKTRRTRFLETTDTQYDNSWFILCVQAGNSPFTCEQTTVRKYYNTRINPNRNLLNYIREFSNGTVKGVGGFLRQTARTGGFVVDNNTIAVSCQNGYSAVLDGTLFALNNPLFKCIFVEFECNMTKSQFDLIKANTRKKIDFSTCDGVVRSGYIEDLRYKLFEQIATIKLVLI
jgi:hypothetical protein